MKLMGLNMKWQQRQSAAFRAKEKQEDPDRARMREDLENMKKSSILSGINSKLNAGAELTDEEMAYLKQNNPQLYQEALDIKREREAYEKALKKCKTKDEVERLNANRMQMYLSQAKAVANNPSIPQGEKKAQLEKILKRVMGIQSEHMKFTATKEYADLPREYEEEKKKKKAEKNEPRLEKKDLVPNDFKEVKELLEKALSEAQEAADSAPAEKADAAAPASEASSAETSLSSSAGGGEGVSAQGNPAGSLSVRI
ncbi:MAG: hypothetical protein HFG27_00705 [Provencibacterium sp.]|nr:hypothetical protein [Provencibacterium sp.]